ncbi:putative GCN5-related N-acetyltransferase [Hyella patelloides LEGE 07179]|uniref:Putative GCN5-related N-acetyltransferase n=1 Tax=Hyella patelloides LEGE 07179 TaxID=945734 RepID=A0A563VZV7_9CYAN|nr:GNAT family N-acetyltransferase [Hyella patelloides]VEP16925.1 putative GCN5-related N-acetyltransferase [Hyella patelloides LEGE 07179]
MNNLSLDFNIRPLSIKDITATFKLKRKSIQTLCSEHYTPQQIEAMVNGEAKDINSDEISIVDSVGLFLAKWIDSYTESNDPGAIVAYIDDKIIGYASRGKSSWLNQRIIYEMFVLPEYARMGVGSKLLETLETNAQNNNCQVITVGASLTGEPFYKVNGYQVIERTDSCSSGVRIPIVHMKKWLATPTEIDKILYDMSGQFSRGVEWLTTETAVLLKEFLGE